MDLILFLRMDGALLDLSMVSMNNSDLSNLKKSNLQGLFASFQVTLHAKMAMSDLQRYP